MDKDRLFNSLDFLGPPFQVSMSEITHSGILAVLAGLRYCVWGKAQPRAKDFGKLANHGFDHWLTPNIDRRPFLPMQPGWLRLMLRSDDELEEWCPDEGTEFQVVIKRELRFLEYVGQYEMMRLCDITRDEWKRQPPKVITPMHTDLFQMVNDSSRGKNHRSRISQSSPKGSL
jgi:hypothetical protein